VYAGYWEFPGGKVEPGESAVAALRRELAEELDIEVERAYPWITRTFVYQHASVRLNFFRVVDWRGEPRGVEGQKIVWQRVELPDVLPMLPANGPVLKALSLPLVYGVSPAVTANQQQFTRDFDRALQGGMRMVQLRDKQACVDQLQDIGEHMSELLRARMGILIVNSDSGCGHGERLARQIGAHGLHLSASALTSLRARPNLHWPGYADWIGASCHDAAEMRRASDLGVDFVVLGPIHITASHPDADVLGWARFRQLAEKYPLPVYAIGGVELADLDIARTHGAHGIAMLSAAWRFA
jgi:8-oxo-dGTP diphosphatase